MTAIHTTWDLSDLCEDSKIAAFSKNLLERANQFKQKYQNVFQEPFKEETLLQAIQDYENLFEELFKLMSFASLKHSINLDNENIGKMYQNASNLYAQIRSDLVFFENGITRMKHKMKANHYTYWIENLQKYALHVLDDATEAYGAQKALTSRYAWVRLYDETLDSITVEVDGKTRTLEEIVSQMNDPSADVRKKAALTLSSELQKRSNIFTRAMNSIVQDLKVENQFRHFENPDDAKHLYNQIEKEVVDLLCETIKENYHKTSHRYYKLKAKLMGKKQIEYWDRNAPAFEEHFEKVPYEEAQKIVTKAYTQFSPTLADLVQKFYDNHWIEVYPKKGKRSGAFADSTVPSVHPYVMLNYQGKLRDIATLAHELGHGAHQILASEQGLFLSDTPLTIAETASVFGEMLTFEALKPRNPKVLIAAKIEDMLNTTIRQIAFYEFEKAVHNNIKEQGELTSTELNALFRKTQEEALGSGVNLDPAIDSYWSYISHFFHSPFYVYAYAFGDCLVNSLYAQYKATDDKKGFEQKYLEFLKAGGSQSYRDLLKPFNLDPTHKSFWEGGLKMISDMIDELEELI